MLKKTTDSILSVLFGKFPALFRLWEKSSSSITFDETYWAQPPEDPFSTKIALVTTGGVHQRHDIPFDMGDWDGDPTYREIPRDATPELLTITHDYYDSKDALEDIGVVFPLGALLDMKSSGEVKDVNGRHFSFMGHIKGRHLVTLMEETAPEVAAKLREDGVDVVILSPA